jgi:hypothetical protein
MRCGAWGIVGILGCLALPAHADPRGDIAAKARAAMVSYDSMDYEVARKLLNQALAIAKKAKLEKDPIVARVYLELGIAQFAASDQEAARGAFLSAAQIDPKITIGAAYKSPELVKLLDEAKAAAAGDAVDADGDDVDCKSVRGLQHAVVELGKPGAPQTIEAYIGRDVAPARVSVMYRPEGAIDFVEARLTRQGGCRYAGTIPVSGMHGSVVHYYIAAYDASNKVLASKGSSGAPNAIELAGERAARTGEDAEDPISGARGAASGGAPSAGVAAGVQPARPAHRITLAVAAGTGVGYVSGKTEGDNQVQKCCLGSSPLVVVAEVAYHTRPHLAVAIAGRLGVPLGANITGHSSIAPAGFARARYALSSTGDGLRFMAEAGFGILRNTIKLDNTVPGMDTDIVAQGPLLLGMGVGYVYRLGSTVDLQLDLNAIAGLAMMKKLGNAIHLNSGIGADMSVGLGFGF